MNRSEAREILLALLRGEPAGAVPPAGWEEIALLADRHGVAPLLHQRLKTLRAGVPEDILESLRAKYRQNAIRNLRLYQRLGELLARFHQEDVPAIVLKGAYLAEHIYGNVG